MINTLIQKKLMCTVITILVFNSAYSQSDTTKLDNLTLKDLLNVNVTTATKISEKLDKVPATVIVITEEQIKMRGYQSLLDVMYDLPDMKVDDKIYSGIRNTFRYGEHKVRKSL